MRSDEKSERVGWRVSVNGERATVKYVGEVDGTAGAWLGVEWDEKGRGKHDGQIDGKRYFTASRSDSASFVRARKLDPATSCALAIQECYAQDEDSQSADQNKKAIDDWKKKIKVPFVEMVGFDSVHKKQSTLDQLLEASVSERRVRSAGELSTLCPSLKILDLSKNLIDDWKTVAHIGEQLPHLISLDLSKNRISPPSVHEAPYISKFFANLKSLSLGHSDVDWEYVDRILLACRHLEELILAYNRITEISLSVVDDVSHLKLLNTIVLDGNPLIGWCEVNKLGTLPSLKVLSLNECQLKSIKFNDTPDVKISLFVNLDTLYLKHNSINDWRSISELNKLSNLQKLYFIKNPLLTLSDYDTVSQMIIARIENLKELNSSEITGDVRRGAEYDYIKKYGLQWKKLKDNDENSLSLFSLEQSRFDSLIKKYGMPDDSLLVEKKRTWAINTNLLELTLEDEASGAVVTKKLPSTMTVQKLSALARKLFAAKIESRNFSVNPELFVYVVDVYGERRLSLLNNQMKDLNFYSVENGSTILIKW